MDWKAEKADAGRIEKLDDLDWVRGQLSYRLSKPVTAIRHYPKLYPPTSFPVCPRCDVTLEREYQSYCDRCGQHLNWRGYGKTTTVIITLPKPDEDKEV